ncbi:porin family protein [Flavimarina sp. Hel_I_48]|uniref:type IX secretion/gliding motility protein PorT/SprT n=1 Tax=Flavimarina sp. Hel_I_48 TaxID=1392488 RepID=UPI0004DEFF79|nr:porin family protein [Flavimarina sp. Hel_I_48]
MRKIIPFFLFLFCAQIGHAQLFSKERLTNIENFDKQRWSWGFFLGLNSYDFKFDYADYQENDILVNQTLGFNVGLLGDMRINDYFNLRLEPGLVFTQREILFPGEFASEQAAIRESNSTYIHVPLLLKVSTKRLNNFKPFIMGGVSYSYNLSSNQDNPDDNFDGQFRMKNNTYYYELGLGIDFYLYYFKFTPSIRGVFALNDELVRDDNTDNLNINNISSPYTGNVDKMATRGIFLNLTFQ